MITTSQIAAKITNERIRLKSVESWFTPKELKFINTFSGETIKERALRAAGKGNCKLCNNPSPYKGKLNFSIFCSKECQNANTKTRNDNSRPQRLAVLKDTLSLQNLRLDNENEYKNITSHLSVFCMLCNTHIKAGALKNVLGHTCETKKIHKMKSVKPKVVKQIRVKKLKQEQRCIEPTCGVLRNPKSKPGRCKDCNVKFNREKTTKQHLQILDDLGFTLIEPSAAWDNHAQVEVTNNECNHTFTAQLGNILTGATVCGVCGPERRQRKMMGGYLKRNAREYNLREYNSYATLVRNKSHTNWRNSNGKIIGSGHTGIHLDHRVPIIYGFKNRISPEVMSDLLNLQLLDYKENIAKGGRIVDYEILQLLDEKYKETQWASPLIQLTIPETVNLRLNQFNTCGDIIEFPSCTVFVARNKRLSFGELPLSDHEKFMIVFQDELLDHRRRIIESMLNHSAFNSKKIHARKCEVREVDSNVASRFMNSNHLSGRINSSIRLGLYHDDILQCLMLCSKSRFDRHHEYEIVRFANKLDTAVVGGLTKLFSEFKKRYDPASVMTYADRRFGQGGKVYEMLGMEQIRSTLPSTWWVKEGQRVNSQDTRVEKIGKLLLNFDSNLPVDLNMERNDWIRIDDLGSNVYSWSK